MRSSPDTPRVAAMLERAAGLGDVETYRRFSDSVTKIKYDLLDFLITAKRAGKSVVGYGAPAKGNTLLNYCGVRSDLLEFTVDRSPHKIGKLLPGVRVPIHDPSALVERRPNYVLILPWNLRDEIMDQMAAVRSWGGKFLTPISCLQIQ